MPCFSITKATKKYFEITSSAKFSTKSLAKNTQLIKKCNDKRCKICLSYLQFTNSFQTASGKIWEIRNEMSCRSKNLIYFLTCNQCEGKVSYIGKTNNLRLRANQHISLCRTGNGSGKFDLHVHQCLYSEPMEPYFKLYLFMELGSEASLLTYESPFHKLHYDILNR